MKILLFGKNGQVGWELNRSLRSLGDVIALSKEQVDFTVLENLRQTVQKIKPDVIVNAAAYTAVDNAEKEENLAMRINGEAPAVLAEEALKLNALMVHYSTDYVFDGTKKSPYMEVDKPNPVNVYGHTKLAGDLAIQSSGCDYLIFRTSWVYASRAHNFLLTMLKLAQEREELRIVIDQIGAPTSARLIADTTVLCLRQSVVERFDGVFSSDLYHLTNSGYTSWYGFAEEIIKIANSLDFDLVIKKIEAIPATDYLTLADRPVNSRLELTKLEGVFAVLMPDWKESLAVCMSEGCQL